MPGSPTCYIILKDYMSEFHGHYKSAVKTVLSVQGIQIVQAIKIVQTFLTVQLCQKFCFFSQQFLDLGEV
jgi:hypothetical protein